MKSNAEILDIMKNLIGAKSDQSFAHELEVEPALISRTRNAKYCVSKRVFLRFLMVTGMTAGELVSAGIPYEYMWR